MDKTRDIVYPYTITKIMSLTRGEVSPMGTVRKIKDAMLNNEKLAGMLVRSGRHTVLLDLDGDRVPDIGLFDLDRDGDTDAVAVDLTGNGEFNFYLIDQDGNGIPDEILFYRDGDEAPLRSMFGPEVEAEMTQKVSQIHELIRVEDMSAEKILDALDALEMYIVEEYAALEEQGIDTEG